VKKDPLSPVSEDYRTLRMNILLSKVDRPVKTLAVTSAGSMEGKSITVANLAVTMAEAGMRVILIDADFRRPTINKIFGVENSVGLTDAILGLENISECIQDTGVNNLRILTSGRLPPNPAQFLISEKFTDIIQQLKEKADILLFDTPPTLLFSDAAILGARLDGVIVIARAGYTRSVDAKRMVEELGKARINLLGCVYNQQKKDYRKRYYYRATKRKSNLYNRIEQVFSAKQ
jgi:capsular exopolysaccharide synthesis family protein